MNLYDHSDIVYDSEFKMFKNGCCCHARCRLEPCSNSISGVVVNMLVSSSAVDHGFEPRSSQTKEYNIGFCCFSAKHAVLRINTKCSKDELARNQSNVS